MSSDPTIDATTDPHTRPMTTKTHARKIPTGLDTSVSNARRAVPRPGAGTPGMTIAAIYGRKSTDDERSADDGRSVDRQVALAREFAAQQGWAVAEPWVITEEASGADFTRAGLGRLLAGARQRPRPFDVLVVMAVDRLGREQVRTAAVVQALHEAGVGIFTYQDGREVSFETPVEKFMVGVHGFGAEEYRHQVKLKTREALHRKAARGHATGSRTYGYQLVRQGLSGARVDARG